VRTYGRNSSGQWSIVQTDAAGFNDQVYLTTLIQTLKLNLGESPFYANYGIPAQQSVAQQIYPDFYVALTQQFFAQYFAALVVARVPGRSPVYSVSVTTQQGYKLNESVPILT
jgi:hypothetical protein